MSLKTALVSELQTVKSNGPFSIFICLNQAPHPEWSIAFFFETLVNGEVGDDWAGTTGLRR